MILNPVLCGNRRVYSYMFYKIGGIQELTARFTKNKLKTYKSANIFTNQSHTMTPNINHMLKPRPSSIRKSTSFY